jgi:hypothetical protein
MITAAWMSAGVSSAVATKLLLDKIDLIFYIHIEDQHSDSIRFVRDCERWYNKKINIMMSPYKSVENALRGACFTNGPHGAPCSRFLKKRVRREWEIEQNQPLRYIWGMDYTEKKRAERLCEQMPKQDHLFPLVEKKISKGSAHQILKASGIKRPIMYDLGFPNNNCIGCVRGGMGYWNKVRVVFPDVFTDRAKMERCLGCTCLNGIFLDELDPNAGRDDGPIVEDCGIMCEIIKL